MASSATPLDPEPPPLALRRLASIATELARRPHRWQVARPATSPAGAGSSGWSRTQHYEAWVLGWDHEQGIELHDHGGSAGGLCVVEGQLVETYTDSWTRRPERTAARPRRSGVASTAAHVHDLVNPGPGIATSVHVYSPPARDDDLLRRRARARAARASAQCQRAPSQAQATWRRRHVDAPDRRCLAPP